jgi:hypothetical protein
MSTKKISELTELAVAPDAADLVIVIDISDTTDAATGTTKKLTIANLLSGYLQSLAAESIESLSDVQSMTPTNGQALMYDPSGWTTGNVSQGVGTRDFTADGAIAIGDPIALQSDGTVKVITTGNANSTDYIGYAETAGADTETVSIHIEGGIVSGLSALTPGTTYYMDTDGTLTAVDNSNKAGRALSATTLLVQTV